MRFVVRILLGAVLGVLTLGALLVFVGPKAWVLATGALLAPIVFLGTFFLWTADRPEEGYEQVLFDRPNTLVSLAMIVLLAGGGFGAGFFLKDEPVDPAEEAYLAQRSALTDAGFAYKSDLQKLAERQLEGDPGEVFGAHMEKAQEIALAGRKYAEGDPERGPALEKAAQQLATMTTARYRCLTDAPDQCTTAQVSILDYDDAVEALP